VEVCYRPEFVIRSE